MEGVGGWRGRRKRRRGHPVFRLDVVYAFQGGGENGATGGFGFEEAGDGGEKAVKHSSSVGVCECSWAI